MKPDGTIDILKAESSFGPEDDEERKIFFSVYEACYEGKLCFVHVRSMEFYIDCYNRLVFVTDKTHCNLVRCMFGELKNHFPSSLESNKITKQFFSDLA